MAATNATTMATTTTKQIMTMEQIVDTILALVGKNNIPQAQRRLLLERLFQAGKTSPTLDDIIVQLSNLTVEN